MHLTTAFRLSFFLTLALACGCLALAETFFLWWMGFFLLGTLVLLSIAFHWEGRWILGDDAANRLGMVIAIGSAFWILYNLPRSEEELQASGVPWPAGLLPHLGPVLILLLLVKLFRPKRLADFWAIQTIGLMMVTLGCLLAAEPLFGVLLVFYLSSLLWSLSLYYMVREDAYCRADGPKTPLNTRMGTLFPLSPEMQSPAFTTMPWKYLGLGRVFGWTGLVTILGLFLFLISPRTDNYQWEPKQLASAGKGLLRTGFDSGMDLNRMGKIEMSQAPAFEVQAMNPRGPKLDLDPETRWFIQTLDYYAQGRWTSWGHGAVPPHLTWGISSKPEPLALTSVEGQSHPRRPPADLADPNYYLYFRVRLESAGALVLAEPISGSRLGLYPYMGNNPVELSLFFDMVGTDTVLANPHGRRRLYQYGQVLRKPADPNDFAAKEINPRYRHFLINQDIPESINRWVHELLAKLPDLNEADKKWDAQGYLPQSAHAKVAQALSRHLSFSGDFGYSLDLQRQQLSLDPMEDFLLNVKEGHCERFAGGLTLMLRSLGIPSRVIKGYRGVENLEQGHYLVRQSHAHSWVQALLEDDKGTHWLTLDPTPSMERINKPTLSWLGWLFQRWSASDNLWRKYIMDYNAEQQNGVMETVRDQMTPDEVSWELMPILLGLGVLVVGIFLAFLIRRRRSWSPFFVGKRQMDLSPASTGFYARFQEVVFRLLNLKALPGHTPREFGQITSRSLENLALDQKYTAIPMRLVDVLYRVRFGGMRLTEEEKRQAENDVDMLENTITERVRRQDAVATVEAASGRL